MASRDDTNEMIEQAVRRVEIELAIDKMNEERARLQTKWAKEERQRQAAKADAKAEEERRFWKRFNGDFSEEPPLQGCAFPEPEKGVTDPAAKAAQRWVDEHNCGQPDLTNKPRALD